MSGREATSMIILVISCLLFGCTITLPSNTSQDSKPGIESAETQSCPALPSSFTEADLVGTWVASYSLNDTDTLILKDDHIYKQIYNDPDGGLRYESEWLEWEIEHRESGYVRIQLKGMRRAGELESIFNRDGGGIDPELFRAIDDCEGNLIEMPDEIVLIASGASYPTPRGILLHQTRLAGSEWTWSFALVENQ